MKYIIKHSLINRLVRSIDIHVNVFGFYEKKAIMSVCSEHVMRNRDYSISAVKSVIALESAVAWVLHHRGGVNSPLYEEDTLGSTAYLVIAFNYAIEGHVHFESTDNARHGKSFREIL